MRPEEFELQRERIDKWTRLVVEEAALTKLTDDLHYNNLSLGGMVLICRRVQVPYTYEPGKDIYIDLKGLFSDKEIVTALLGMATERVKKVQADKEAL